MDTHSDMQFAPAYGMCDSTDHAGPQCSSCPGEFCFFCAFEADPEAAGGELDLYGSLVELVHTLGEQKKEVPTMVQTISRVYRETVQPHIEWTNPVTGVVVKSPVFTKDMIRRHLLHSNQFSGLFTSVVRQIFHSLICAHNETLMCAETGRIIEDHKKSFLETIDSYRKWNQSVGDSALVASKGSGVYGKRL